MVPNLLKYFPPHRKTSNFAIIFVGYYEWLLGNFNRILFTVPDALR